MPDIQIINPINYPGWDDLILSTQDYSFFHSASWAKVLSKSYNYNPLYFTIIDKNRLLGLVPLMEIKSVLTGRRGVSLPFSDYCEPIISEEIFFRDIFKNIINYGKKSGWKYIELRGGSRFFQNISPSSYYYAHTLDLTQNAENIFSDFRDSTSRNVKKAIREGVEVKISNSLDSIKEFYRLNCMTRRHHGLPPQPFYFFKNLYDHVISKKQGIITLGFYNKKVIAGAVYLHFGENVVFKYGAWDKAFQRLRPNNLVMWESIKAYLLNGYRSFSFGRTKAQHLGLLQFKEGWNVERRLINYFKYDIRKENLVNKGIEKFDCYSLLLSKMPPSVLNYVGSLLYKHIG